MKRILEITEADLDSYWDWLVGEVVLTFIDGGFTHILSPEGVVVECEVVRFERGGIGVCLGEDIGLLQEYSKSDAN